MSFWCKWPASHFESRKRIRGCLGDPPGRGSSVGTRPHHTLSQTLGRRYRFRASLYWELSSRDLWKTQVYLDTKGISQKILHCSWNFSCTWWWTLMLYHRQPRKFCLMPPHPLAETQGKQRRETDGQSWTTHSFPSNKKGEDIKSLTKDCNISSMKPKSLWFKWVRGFLFDSRWCTKSWMYQDLSGSSWRYSFACSRQ